MLNEEQIDGELFSVILSDCSPTEWRRFALWCADQVRHMVIDGRSIKAIDAARSYLDGLVSEEELEEAWECARAACSEGPHPMARFAWPHNYAKLVALYCSIPPRVFYDHLDGPPNPKPKWDRNNVSFYAGEAIAQEAFCTSVDYRSASALCHIARESFRTLQAKSLDRIVSFGNVVKGQHG